MKIPPPTDAELRMFVEQSVKCYPHESAAMASELLLAREALAYIKRIVWPKESGQVGRLTGIRAVLDMYGYGREKAD
jgi:hypothetical protein